LASIVAFPALFVAVLRRSMLEEAVPPLYYVLRPLEGRS
jgi:hypothetical protein